MLRFRNTVADSETHCRQAPTIRRAGCARRLPALVAPASVPVISVFRPAELVGQSSETRDCRRARCPSHWVATKCSQECVTAFMPQCTKGPQRNKSLIFQAYNPGLKRPVYYHTVPTGRACSRAPIGATESSPVLQCRDRGCCSLTDTSFREKVMVA